MKLILRRIFVICSSDSYPFDHMLQVLDTPNHRSKLGKSNLWSFFLQIDEYLIYIKQITHQKTDSSRAFSLSKSDNTVNKSTIAQSSIQSMLNSLENGKCSVIFLHPTCSYNHSNNPHQWYPPLLQLIFTSLFYLTTILIDIHFLYTSVLFLLTTFTNLFPSLDHSANSDSTKIPMNKWFLCGLALF